MLSTKKKEKTLYRRETQGKWNLWHKNEHRQTRPQQTATLLSYSTQTTTWDRHLRQQECHTVVNAQVGLNQLDQLDAGK